MATTNSIVAENLKAWRDARGLTARENWARQHAEEIAAHELEVVQKTACCEARLAKATRCGAKVPVGAVDVVFRRGAQNEGGRLRWAFIVPPQAEETLILV